MPLILAFLAKDWKYLVVIAALMGGIGYVYHKGEVHVEAADAKAVAAQIKRTTEDENVIKAKVATAVAEYDALAPIPEPRPVPVLMCYSSGSGAVPKGGQATNGSNGAGTGVPIGAAQAGAGFDPAPAVSATGTAADVEIEHLQKKIKLLQDLVHAYQDGGLVAK